MNGEPIGSLGDGEAVWHTDMSYLDLPPKASMLYALEIPPTGGNTSFCTMYGIYEALPQQLKVAPLADQSIFVKASLSGVGREGPYGVLLMPAKYIGPSAQRTRLRKTTDIYLCSDLSLAILSLATCWS